MKNSNCYQKYFVDSKFYDTGTKLDLFMFQESRKGRKYDSSHLQIFNEPEVTSAQMGLFF